MRKFHKKLDLKVARMIEFYERSHSLAEVGAEFGGLSKARIGQIFKDVGYPARKFTVSLKMRSRVPGKGSLKISEEELRQSYETRGESVNSLARALDCPAWVVKRLLIFYQIPVRGCKEANRLRVGGKNGLTDDLLKNLRTEKKLPVAEIARLYEYAENTIYQRLRRIGLGRKKSRTLRRRSAAARDGF